MKKTLLILFISISYISFSQCVDPMITDFECSSPSHPFGGAGIVSIANPVSGGINTSANVGEFTDDGLNAWDNLFIDYESAIDLSTNSVLHIKIHTNALAGPIPILAKLEGGTQMEIWGNIDVIGDWKEYTFDFSSAAGNGNTKVVLFFNGGATTGTASDIYYIDDLYFDEPVTASACVDPIITDFECTTPSHPLSGAITSITNPVSGGINNSSNVGEYTDDGTNGWDSLIIDYGEAIDLSLNNQLKFKLYSPTSIQVMVKLEGGVAQEIWSGFSNTNVWEEFIFDFTGSIGDGNTKIVLFFNANVTSGTSTDIYYIDDLEWGSATLSVDNISSPNNIKIFPNPVINRINIESNKGVIKSFSVSDTFGRVLINEAYNGLEIDLSVLSSGQYFLNMKTDTSNEVFKILKK